MDYYNSKCVDMFPVSSHGYKWARHFLSLMHDATGDRALLDCGQVASAGYCSRDDEIGLRARGSCPVSCGCSDLALGLALKIPNGCPRPCANTPQYNASTWRQCQDL